MTGRLIPLAQQPLLPPDLAKDAKLHVRVLAYLSMVAPGVRVRPLAIPKGQIRFSGTDHSRVGSASHELSKDAAVLDQDPASSIGTVRRTQGWGWVFGAVEVHGHVVAVSGPLLSRQVKVRERRIEPDSDWSFAQWLWPDPAGLVRLGDLALTPANISKDRIRVLVEETDTGGQPPLTFEPVFGVYDPTHDDYCSGVPLVDGVADGEIAAASTAAQALWGDDDGAAAANKAPAVAPSVPIVLNPLQRRAVASATSKPLTVVSGPPGTGKTHLLVAIALAQLAQGRNALLVCTSTTAVDAIGTMLRRFPMVTAIGFDKTTHPVVLGNRLADGTDDGDPRFNLDLAKKQLATLDKEIDQLVAKVTARLRLAAKERSGIDQTGLPSSGTSIGGDHSAGAVPAADRFDELRMLVATAEAAGWRRALSRHRARRALSDALGTGADLPLDDLRQRVDEIGAASVHTGAGSISELWSRIDNLEQVRFEAAAVLLEAQRRTSVAPRDQRSLGNLAGALRRPAVERRAILRSADKNFLGAAPLWFGTLDSVHAMLPKRPEAFDLVVFDESAQISQIDAWPALERAKRVVVIGDPRQLRHESMTGDADHDRAAAAAGLSLEERDAHHEATMSVYDVAAQRSPAIRLEEHFRCSPHIIGFSSERFYEGRLRLMTNHPSRESRDAIHIDLVPPPRLMSQSVAANETQAATVRLQQLLEHGFTSIGIVAATNSVAPMVKAAVNRILPKSKRRGLEIHCGTVDEFQGLEFDAMIVVVGINPSDLTPLVEVESPAAFNVMVTRARRDVYVVTSLDYHTLPDGLLRDYLEWSEYPNEPFARAVDASGWTGELARDLDATPGLRVVTDYPVGDHCIDIVVGTGVEAFGIETVVHPDGPEAHIERHLALRRAGWTLFDALESDWAARRGECAPWLVAQWKLRGGSEVDA